MNPSTRSWIDYITSTLAYFLALSQTMQTNSPQDNIQAWLWGWFVPRVSMNMTAPDLASCTLQHFYTSTGISASQTYLVCLLVVIHITLFISPSVSCYWNTASDGLQPIPHIASGTLSWNIPQNHNYVIGSQQHHLGLSGHLELKCCVVRACTLRSLGSSQPLRLLLA